MKLIIHLNFHKGCVNTNSQQNTNLVHIDCREIKPVQNVILVLKTPLDSKTSKTFIA